MEMERSLWKKLLLSMKRRLVEKSAELKGRELLRHLEKLILLAMEHLTSTKWSELLQQLLRHNENNECTETTRR